MSIELKQAAQDAAEAIDWLLKNIRLNAPHLSGKAMGNAEKCASALRTAIQQATQPAEVTDSMIREAFLANGFTIKEGHNDLKPYVYAAARAILALRPVQVPMTEYQVWHNDALMSANGIAGFKMDALMRIVRAVEAHHFGITAQAKKEQA